MDGINRIRFLVLLYTLIQGAQVRANIARIRRGFGEYNLFGNSRQLAFDEINRNQDIALWSAQSAVTSSVGQEYGQQLAALAQSAHQFSIPSTSDRKGNVNVNPDQKCDEHDSHDTKGSHKQELRNRHDHSSYPVVIDESDQSEKEGHRVVRIPNEGHKGSKKSSTNRWVGIRVRPNRKGRKTSQRPPRKLISKSEKEEEKN